VRRQHNCSIAVASAVGTSFIRPDEGVMLHTPGLLVGSETASVRYCVHIPADRVTLARDGQVLRRFVTFLS
jgi:hypothetical protein